MSYACICGACTHKTHTPHPNQTLNIVLLKKKKTKKSDEQLLIIYSTDIFYKQKIGRDIRLTMKEKN